MIQNKRYLDALLKHAQANPGRVVVPCADNEEALEAICMALDDRVVNSGTLIGDRGRIEATARKAGLALDRFQILESSDMADAAQKAARMVAHGEGDFLLKGQIDTKYYMKAILDKSLGLVPAGNTLSHIALLELPTYHKLLVVSDAAITIDPPVDEKLKVVQNAVDVTRRLGVAKPKVAMIAAVEKVNPKMVSTVHADEGVKKARDGAIHDAIIEGPYDIYIATSKEGAEIKGVKGEVCGDADILVFPEINSANVFYKSMIRFVPDARVAGLIAGATIPIVLPSRADPAEAKRLSLIAAAYLKR